MKVCDATIAKLSKIIKGDKFPDTKYYRKGKALVYFFNLLGFNDRYGEDGYGKNAPSRKVYTEKNLRQINGTSGIDDAIKLALNPIDFIENIDILYSLIDDINGSLKYDGYTIKIMNNEIKIEKNNFTVANMFIADSAKNNTLEQKEYDFFISHASEDKDDFVRELVEALKNEGLKVWYDDFVLQVGDSLRRSIDKGLVNSKYGIVVISENFLRKIWTQYELDGMISKEIVGPKMVLPIWHKVTKEQIMRYSPTLADRVALNTGTQTMSEIVNKLKDVLNS